MNIPIEYYRTLIQAIKNPYQINTDYDVNGDEIYSGIAENRALVTDPIWAIGKAIYTNNGTVNLLTHWSFLTGVKWSDRASLVFP